MRRKHDQPLTLLGTPPASPVFAPLPRVEGGFSLVMADPPWKFRVRSEKGITAKGAEGQYRCLDLDAIKSLGPMLRDVCARNCLLFLWATNPMLREAFEVLDAWGFRFSTAGAWAKIGTDGRVQQGTGMRLAVASEPFLVGIRGNVPVPERGLPGLIVAPRRSHSEKPEEAYRLAERMVAPGVARLDLFSRRTRDGWTAYGDEADKFDEGRAAA